MLNVACTAADPLAGPTMASAEPEITSQSPFSSISPGENSAMTPTPTTPLLVENSGSEQLGSALPELTPIEPVSTEGSEQSPVTLARCTATETDMQQRMLQLINEARATERRCGDDEFAATRELRWNDLLVNAARRHSDDMATHNFFSHTGSDGSSGSTRVSEAGYRWRTVGENIAAGRELAAETLNDWLESPGHCRNIMNPSFTEVAVVCSEENDSDFTRYWTNVLAAPR